MSEHDATMLARLIKEGREEASYMYNEFPYRAGIMSQLAAACETLQARIAVLEQHVAFEREQKEMRHAAWLEGISEIQRLEHELAKLKASAR